MATPLKRLLSKTSGTFSSRRSTQFLAAWMRSPLKIGALVPSSRALAFAMAREVDTKISGEIIELGAGTGAVTHALLASNIAPQRLIVVERDPRLFGILQNHYPDLRIVRGDAQELGKMLGEMQCRKVAAIVSSLPLLSMPRAVRHAITEQMASVIGVDGAIIQFTYGAQSPISSDQLRHLKLYGKRTKFVVTNVPPAHVWVYKKDRRDKGRR